jgi:GTP-binding protein
MSDFIDKVKVFVTAGSGGSGCLSFRRLKFLEFGGPNGGDGGKGADVYFEASPRLSTLLDLSRRPHIKAPDGSNGKSSNKTGDSGQDSVFYVPVGSVFYRDAVIVADLTKPGQRFLAAKGGRGGRGNLSFKTHRNTAPRLFEKGAPGESFTLTAELKLIADVGFVGFPNAGKSSLLSAVSQARPKVADYPFTTLSPHLGVASHKDVHFVCADIPGLIEGAHSGKGLGDDFLRHIERTRILVHLVDPAGFGGHDAVAGIRVIEKELKSFSRELAEKTRLLVVNKMDVPEAPAVLKKVKASFSKRDVLAISAATGQGLKELLDRILLELSRHEGPVNFQDRAVSPELLRVDRGFEVRPMGGGRYELAGQFVRRASAMLDATLPEAVDRFQRTLKRIGVDKALKQAGVQEGDRVKCGDYEFEWTDRPYRALPRLRRDKRTRIGVGKK